MSKIFEFKGSVSGANLAHVASLSIDIYSFAKKYNFDLQPRYDDLDSFDCLNLCLEDGFYFSLYKYKNLPDGTVELFFESQLQNWRDRFENISKILDCENEKILWLNQDYLKTP
jgi:hypothetical protein